MRKQYTIGVDFGTLSARAVLADLETGEILADSVSVYANAVLDRQLPETGEALPAGWALEDPADWEEALYATISGVIRKSGVEPEKIIGVGVDFTSATVLPLDQNGRPLCQDPAFRHEKNAWPKLWKHHGAQKQAVKIRRVLESMDPERLSSNFQLAGAESEPAKVLQTLEEAPEVYRAAAHFAEAGDYMVSLLTGKLVQNRGTAGLKSIYSMEKGWPDRAVLTAIHPEFANYLTEKWNQPLLDPGEKAGTVTAAASERTGLPVGCAVAVSVIDGHAAPPACGLRGEDTPLLILGTGSTTTVLSKTYRFVDGTCGTVRDGILPGFYGYEAGQCCVGDQYAWYAAHCGLNQWELTDKAARLTPGESGLVAVDWWNGSRSPYMNEKLKGVISGLRLSTRPEEVYRAMLESTAFGCRNIYDRFRQAGFRFREIRATGGIPGKNPLVMQIYADVLGLPIRLAGMQYGSALGSAMFAGLAAGAFANMTEAMDRMEDLSDTVYTPNPENTEIYDRLYGRYRRIIDFFRQEYENESVKEENAPSAKRKTLLC